LDLQLENRVAVVSAASQGVGHATALQLSREGALVAICSRDEARITAAADAITSETGNPVLAIKADITNDEDVTNLMERTVDEFGGIDILVTNCGGPPPSSFEEVPMEAWDAAIQLIFLSAVRLVHAALPHLRLSAVPSVLAITSISVKQPVPNLILSNSIRMGVIGLIKTLSVELGPEGIRFNSILPSYIETERVHDLLMYRAAKEDTSLEEQVTRQINDIPLGRMGTPEEFANVAAFLCSPAASYVNGSMINFDGGSYRGVY